MVVISSPFSLLWGSSSLQVFLLPSFISQWQMVSLCPQRDLGTYPKAQDIWAVLVISGSGHHFVVSSEKYPSMLLQDSVSQDYLLPS